MLTRRRALIRGFPSFFTHDENTSRSFFLFPMARRQCVVAVSVVGAMEAEEVWAMT
jgi:hypothetical protein